MATRTLYAGQVVKIITASTALTGLFPVQSASCEVTRPVEFISAFGHINNVAAAQNSFTTCKSSVKLYLQSGGTTEAALGVPGTDLTGAAFNAAFIRALTGDAIGGQKTVISVEPNGFIMSGIMSNLGMDISVGAFGTADLSFDGIGEPVFQQGAASVSFTEPTNPTAPTAITPVTSTNVVGGITGAGCANSFRFSLSLPNETLACLGDSVTGSQPQLGSSVMIAKLPLRATISVEGHGVDVSSSGVNNADNALLSSTISTAYNLGGITMTLPNPKLMSKSFNNAVGNVGASYNYTIEDVNVNFS